MTVVGQDDVALVGRERELALLREAVSAASAGRASAVLLAGESGVGKSRLVRALLEDQRDALVVRVQCVDLGDPGLPYLAVTDLLRALGVDGVASDGPQDESARLQLFDRAARLLAGSDQPVVVVVEDVQWVDASSADFLRFLLSRMTAERLAVLLTVRTDGLGSRPAAGVWSPSCRGSRRCAGSTSNRSVSPRSPSSCLASAATRAPRRCCVGPGATPSSCAPWPKVARPVRWQTWSQRGSTRCRRTRGTSCTARPSRPGWCPTDC